MTAGHNVEVTLTLTLPWGYHAFCQTCGWSSRVWGTKADASTDADRHVRGEGVADG